MSIKATPSNETLIEKFTFGIDKSLEIQFHQLYKSNPDWAYAITPIFYKNGKSFHEYDTVWEDLQESQSPEAIASSIINRVNEKLEDMDNGGDEKMSWNEELLFIFRTRVIFDGSFLQLN